MTGLNDLDLVLSDWNTGDAGPPLSVRRELLRSQPEWTADLVLVVQGVRRCGKSTLLRQIIQHWVSDPARCFFINFEDPRLSEILDFKLLDEVVAFAHKRFPNKEPIYFFFDEIQNVSGWEKWLHSQVERPGQRRFAVTGSNAALLAGELGAALTGRHRTIELFPFSLSEFRLARPNDTLEAYLEWGGFPRAVQSESKENAMALLREYFRDIIERDVREHVAARSSLALTQLAKIVYETTGSEASLRSLAQTMGTTVDTVRVYIDAFEAAYLVLPCPFFTFSERKRAVRPYKYYPVDLGLRTAVATRTGLDLGKRLETAVFHWLRRRESQVYFWRGQGEVDFVVVNQEGITPYQVSWNSLEERHTRALAEFKKEYPQSNEPVFIHRSNFETLCGDPK